MQFLLKALLAKDVFNKYGEVTRGQLKTDEEKEIYRAIEILHERTEGDLSLSDVAIGLRTVYPAKKAEALAALVSFWTDPVDPTLVASYFADAVRKAKAYEIAMKAGEVFEGKAEYADLMALFNTEDVTEADPEYDFVSHNLSTLQDRQIASGGFKWRLDALNKLLGSLPRKRFGFIFARPECFTPDTEVLTPEGWKFVAEVTQSDRIASVTDTLDINFEVPSHIECHHEDDMYEFADGLGRVSMGVSAKHRMLTTWKGEWREQTAEDAIYYQGKKHHTIAKATGARVFTPLDALRVAYQADGATRVYRQYGHIFSFKKVRKIERLASILANLGYEFSTYVDGTRGHTGFYIKSPIFLEKNFDWVDLEGISLDFARDFIEELSYWDSTRRTPGRFKFDTSSKEVADKVQAICALAGYNCCHSVFPDTRKESYSDIHSLSIRTNYQPIDGQSIKKSRLAYSGNVYCFTVSTGKLLIRRNRAVGVCGNTGKTLFLTSEISNFALQTDEPIFWLANEEDPDTVMIRFYCALFGVNEARLFSNLVKYQEEFNKRIGDRLIITGDPQLNSKLALQRAFKQHKPAIVVIDQLDNINGFKADREDLRCGAIYKWFRGQGIAHNFAAIGVTQAGSSAENEKWLRSNMVAESHTTKAAAADWMLGIGKKHDNDYERFLHTPKDKLPLSEGKDPAKRHGYATVMVNAETSRYEDQA